MKGNRASLSPSVLFVFIALMFTIPASNMASAQTMKVLYSFSGNADGGQPYAKLIADPSGNGYGTTGVGGDLSGCPGLGCGVVFELTKAGKYTVLYTFHGGADGANPWSGLVRDSAGNLYGTTEAGGSAGFGTVFQLSPSGQKTVLYNFQGNGTDGAYPFGQLISDGNGTFYGTTYKGGRSNFGTVYKLSGAGETVLYSFKGFSDGDYPYAGVVRDSAGNLYGTTFGDGLNSYGTVFRLSPSGKETVLHSFSGGTDGGFPYYGSLVLDPATGIYGTTSFGGAHNYFGTVFKVDKKGQFSVIYSFSNGLDGGQPNASLIRDSSGNLYGATLSGGTNSHGVIFKMEESGNETVLYNFAGGTDPVSVQAPLLRDAAGNLYGTSIAGGSSGQGTVFKLKP